MPMEVKRYCLLVFDFMVIQVCLEREANEKCTPFCIYFMPVCGSGTHYVASNEGRLISDDSRAYG